MDHGAKIVKDKAKDVVLNFEKNSSHGLTSYIMMSHFFRTTPAPGSSSDGAEQYYDDKKAKSRDR